MRPKEPNFGSVGYPLHWVELFDDVFESYSHSVERDKPKYLFDRFLENRIHAKVGKIVD